MMIVFRMNNSLGFRIAFGQKVQLKFEIDTRLIALDGSKVQRVKFNSRQTNARVDFRWNESSKIRGNYINRKEISFGNRQPYFAFSRCHSHSMVIRTPLEHQSVSFDILRSFTVYRPFPLNAGPTSKAHQLNR